MKARIQTLIIVLILLLGIACMAHPTALWAAPNLVNFQGSLTDSGGTPVPDGNYSMTIRVYDALSAGTLLWEESQTVAVKDGIYNVLLGSGTPGVGSFDPALFSGDNRWLGVEVNGEVLSPRQRITSVAWSLRAQDAVHAAAADIANGTVANGVSTTMIKDSAVTTNKLKNNAVTGGKIANGTIIGSKIADNTITSAKVLDGSGSGLDADLLDGLHSSGFAAVSHPHSGADITTGIVADARIESTIARDAELTWGNLSGIPAGFADGVDNVGILSEIDPEVGANTTNYVPRWNGSALVSGSIFDNGFIGIGTTSPSDDFEVARDQDVPGILATGYRDAYSAGNFEGRKARGTMASPSAVLADDVLATFGGYGYGATGWPAGTGKSRARMQIAAAENWTDTAQGTYMNFQTTPAGSTAKSERMRITDAGDVGIGTNNPAAKLHIETDGTDGAGLFLIDNASNTYPVFHAETNGTGGAGIFRITNPSSNSNVLSAETYGINSDAGIFIISNPSNNYTALHAETNGIGGAGIFRVTNPSSINAALYAETYGTNTAVSGHQFGTGGGATFKIENPSNNYNALHAETNGTGYSGLFLGGKGVSISGNLNVTGNLTKGSGSFVQPHPSDPQKEIVYAFFEGPEHAVFLRGTAKLENGKASICTPEYFRDVAAEEGITVQFTPRSLDSKGLAAYKVAKNKIEVGELLSGTGTYEFDYFITAKRAGFEKHEPIQENKHFRADNVTREEFEERYAKTDDMTILAMRNLLISNGILTKDGKLNMEVVQKFGWKVKEAEKSSELATAGNQP